MLLCGQSLHRLQYKGGASVSSKDGVHTTQKSSVIISLRLRQSIKPGIESRPYVIKDQDERELKDYGKLYAQKEVRRVNSPNL